MNTSVLGILHPCHAVVNRNNQNKKTTTKRPTRSKVAIKKRRVHIRKVLSMSELLSKYKSEAESMFLQSDQDLDLEIEIIDLDENPLDIAIRKMKQGFYNWVNS